MAKTRLKPKKDSIIDIINKYSNDIQACIMFFFQLKWPTGFYCEKCGCKHYYFIKNRNVFCCSECGHQHYLLAGTIFEKNKLPLFKLILGLYMFFVDNEGVSAAELRTQLDINYKSALKLCNKCRILMTLSNSKKKLDSLFYEADTIYIGSKSENKQGMSTDQQPVFMILSTDKENKYPKFIKLCAIPVDNKNYINRFFHMNVIISKERTLNTDGETTFGDLSQELHLKSEKINYKSNDHRLLWQNIIAGNIQNNIIGIYHGVNKRALPLFLQEQEWRFNHRYTGQHIMEKISKYISISFPVPGKKLGEILDLVKPYFSACV